MIPWVLWFVNEKKANIIPEIVKTTKTKQTNQRLKMDLTSLSGWRLKVLSLVMGLKWMKKKHWFIGEAVEFKQYRAGKNSGAGCAVFKVNFRKLGGKKNLKRLRAAS